MHYTNNVFLFIPLLVISSVTPPLKTVNTSLKASDEHRNSAFGFSSMKSYELTSNFLLELSKFIQGTQTYLVYLEKVKNQH